MKSHLIPDPKPIERCLSSSDAASMYLLDQLFAKDTRLGKAQAASEHEFRPAPQMPMRNFLRVVFAG